MAVLSEHRANIEAAIEAAVRDGYTVAIEEDEIMYIFKLERWHSGYRITEEKAIRLG